MNQRSDRPQGFLQAAFSFRKKLWVLLELIMGFVLSIVLFLGVLDWEKERLEGQFAKWASNVALNLQRRVESHLEILHAISAWPRAFSPSIQPAYHDFVRDTLSKHASILYLGWAAYVPASQRIEYEENGPGDSSIPLEIRETDAQGKSVRAAPRAEYFPIHYLQPANSSGFSLGLDLGSEGAYAKEIENARKTGKPVATRPFESNQDPQKTSGFLVFLPVYRDQTPPGPQGGPTGDLVGLTMGVYRVDLMLKEWLENLRGQGIDVRLYDTTEQGSKPLLYAEATLSLKAAEEAEVLNWRGVIQVGDRTWSLLCTATPGYLAANRTLHAWGILTGGLLLTGLLGVNMFRELDRSSTIEQQVAERTAELAKANEDLKGEITERKRVEVELQAAKEAAEAASEAKSNFLANMSHEIRTPMNGIIGMTELALDTPLTAEQREYLETVENSTNALLSLINDILDFSKIEAGKLDLVTETFDLRHTLGETMATLAIRAHQKNLELCFHVAPDLPDRLLGDVSRLRQVLVNLIGNAIKFTEKGEVVLRVQRDSASDGQVLLHFLVSDTGIGIPREKHQLIFEAFEQADSTTTRRYGGTGLGLAISSQLVQMMGGRIWVESEVAKGSTFHFTACFGLGKDTEQTLEETPLRDVDVRNMHVLVVDDNETNRRLLQEVLASWGMKPTLVVSGYDALAALERAKDRGEPFELILTDVNMPEMDGFGLVERIRKNRDLTRATIMMLSSADRNKDIERCHQLGISAYLLKPIHQSNLMDAILQAIQRAVASVPHAPPPQALASRPLNILLAEDNLVNQKLTARMLEKAGHTVTIAGNGKEAIEALERQGNYDVILMDVQMPEIGGLEATALIRAKEKSTETHVPIIAMTAHAMKGDREHCLEAGMDGYVTKPVHAQELFDAIQALVPSPSTPPMPEPASISSDTGSALDRKALQERFAGDSELLGQIIDLFFEDTPKMMAEIRDAVSRRDPQSLSRAAHTLKGSVRNFFAEDAGQAAFRLEEMGRRGDLTQAEEFCAKLHQAMEQVTCALQQVRKEI